MWLSHIKYLISLVTWVFYGSRNTSEYPNMNFDSVCFDLRLPFLVMNVLSTLTFTRHSVKLMAISHIRTYDLYYKQHLHCCCDKHSYSKLPLLKEVSNCSDYKQAALSSAFKLRVRQYIVLWEGNTKIHSVTYELLQFQILCV